MSSFFQQAQQAVGKEMTKARWAIGINGALLIALGVVILVWPNISLYSLVIVFGAFALARGVIGLVASISTPVVGHRGWLILNSLLGIAVGVLVFWNTGMSALALLYVIGAYAVALGVITVGGAFWLPLDGTDRVLFVLTGFVSILFGIVMFSKPGAGALAVLALIAAYSLVLGLGEVTVAIGGERLLKRALLPATARKRTAEPQPQH